MVEPINEVAFQLILFKATMLQSFPQSTTGCSYADVNLKIWQNLVQLIPKLS
jgi:hypothetical protein